MNHTTDGVSSPDAAYEAIAAQKGMTVDEVKALFDRGPVPTVAEHLDEY